MKKLRQEHPALPPVLEPNQDYGRLVDQVSGVILRQPAPRFWWGGFLLGLSLLMIFMLSTLLLFGRGVGIWGLQVPVAWAFDITNFVWWVGIGHAGTLISAILLLVKQDWRNSINRLAEAMTVFAVTCAGLFPILHLGRPQVAYFILPYPNTMELWPQFRSPLVWDVFAVTTYFTVSLVFWYVGMIPDLATMRDRSRNRLARRLYGVAALGWRGAARHWQRYRTAYLVLAALATPLVVSVHSIVGLDFAVSVVPGWHATIFPPYFVAGAILSGMAMVLTLAIPLRAAYGLHNMITARHIDFMCYLAIATSLLVGYGYFSEAFFAWYSGSGYERFMMADRIMGDYAWAYWGLILFNVLAPQTFWLAGVRRALPLVWVISLVINVGMWLERFVIIAGSLSRGYTPSIWLNFRPTIWDFATMLGSMGIFITGMFLFIRLLPLVTIHEVSELVHHQKQLEGRLGEVAR